MAVATSRTPVRGLRRGRTARVCDGLLAWCVLALGTWTAAYHVCLLLGLAPGWGLGILAAGLLPCGVVAVWAGALGEPAPPEAGGPARGARAAAVVAGCAAVAAAGALALLRRPWPPVWAGWGAPPPPLAGAPLPPGP